MVRKSEIKLCFIYVLNSVPNPKHPTKANRACCFYSNDTTQELNPIQISVHFVERQ